MFQAQRVSEVSSAADPWKMRRRVVALAAAAIVITVGMILTANLPSRHDEPLRVAINPWPAYEFATLAREKGSFEQEGVNVRLVELSSLGDCKRAFERRQVDGMFSTIVEVMLVRRGGERDARATLIIDYSDGADVILARQTIESLAGLRGKRIAAEAGSLNEVLLLRAVASAGMDWSDINVVWMPQLDMPRAFATGQIDAAVCYPPISIEIGALGGKISYSTKEIPGVIMDVLAFDPAVISGRREDIDAFQRAFFRAQEYARDHPDEAYAIMAAREGLSPEEFAAALTQGVRILGRAEQESLFSRNGTLARAEEIIAHDLDILDGIKRSGTSTAESSGTEE